MTVRLSSLQAMSRNCVCQIAAAAAIVFVIGGVQAAQAATANAASAPAAASEPLAAGSQYTIRPGQSLNDVAIAATQSRDRATLSRASKALFDANPNAFVAHDPSRLRLGSVLTIPALDATGAALAASGTSSGASTAAAASSPAQASTAASAVSQPAAASQANVATAAAHGAHGAPATANSTSAPLQASSAMAAAASAPAAGSAPATATAAPASATAGASSAMATAALPTTPASSAHVWTGSIQASASAPGTASSALPAAQAPTQVSSLQQLLALKSRVLMELQKHGIGGSPARPSQAGSATSVANGAASGPAVPGNGGMANSHAAAAGGNDVVSPANLGVAAIIGAALVALLAGLGLRRRKRAASAADAAAAAQAGEVGLPEAFSGEDTSAAHAKAVAREAAAQREAARETAEREAAAHEAAARQAAAQETAEREAAEAAARESAEREAAEAAAHDTATQEEFAREAAAREAAARDAALRGNSSIHAPSAAVSSDVAGYEPAVSQGDAAASDAHVAGVQPESAETGHASSEMPQAAVPPALAGGSSPAGLGAGISLSEQLNSAGQRPSDDSSGAPDRDDQRVGTPPDEISATGPVADFNPLQPEQDAEPHHGEMPFDLAPDEPSAPFAAPFAELDAPTEPAPLEPAPYADHILQQSYTLGAISPAELLDGLPAEPALPGEFPRDAVDAFGSLDMGLPPRVESPDDVAPPAPLATQSVAQQAVPQPASPRQVADQIAAGTAGAAAVAGLGAARFGALNLDFDLELPPGSAQPVSLFTPQDLARIARNKLDLASEYIELGDLAGARTLIHEVIEANDAATQTEARALLSTLSPLS